MQAQPISSLGFPSTSQAQDPNSAGALKTDFLTLLVAQIQSQDPLNPRDPAEFTSQLAEFSTLEQLVGINQILEQQSQLQTAAIGTAAAGFIGKTAEVLSDRVNLKAGDADPIRYNQFATSSSTTINIYDSADRVVRTIELGPTNSGDHEFEWDGLTNSGATAAEGIYRVEVVPKDAAGEAIDVEVTTLGQVSGVKFVNGVVLLEINGEHYQLGDLVSLREPSADPIEAVAEENSPEIEDESLLSKILPF